MSETKSPIILDSTGQAILQALKDIANKTDGSAFNNAGFHNAVFRGNSLGTSVSDDQWSEIKAGTFKDMYIGDYWTINNVVYRIAAFDWWLHYGATEMKSHHAVLVPDVQLYTAQMNTSNTTSGAYWNSAMKQSNLATALTTVQTAFGSAHILTRSALMPTASSGNDVTGWAWEDTSIDLMTERMVYGNAAWGQATHNGYDAGTDYNQLPLFRLAPEFIIARDASGNRQWWWLRDVRSAANFAAVNDIGDANHWNASNSFGVRPAFLIG